MPETMERWRDGVDADAGKQRVPNKTSLRMVGATFAEDGVSSDSALSRPVGAGMPLLPAIA